MSETVKCPTCNADAKVLSASMFHPPERTHEALGPREMLKIYGEDIATECLHLWKKVHSQRVDLDQLRRDKEAAQREVIKVEKEAALYRSVEGKTSQGSYPGHRVKEEKGGFTPRLQEVPLSKYKGVGRSFGLIIIICLILTPLEAGLNFLPEGDWLSRMVFFGGIGALIMFFCMRKKE